MKKIRLKEILPHIGGVIVQGSGNPFIENVITTTKKGIYGNTLFFHLDKKTINRKSYKNNSSLVIVTDEPDPCRNLGDSVILVKVKKIKTAYWKFVHYYRNLFQIPVIGITGTCGKTTTKEMIKHILRKDYHVCATYRNINSNSKNLRYLLKINDKTDVAVFEMPVASPNYLNISRKYFQPQIRLLLNIGVYHLTGCKTPEKYLKAKAQILNGLDPVNGTLILNADDENIKKIDVSRFQKVVTYFGQKEGAHFRGKDIRYADKGMNFTLQHQGKNYQVFVPGYGEHNVYNALAAIAAVSKIGVPIQKAIHRLSTYKHIKEHLEFKKGRNGCTVIDDTWNTSSLSMEAALQVLKDVAKGRRTIAILGYMPRLGTGTYATREYAQMGAKAVKTGVDILVVTGDQAREIGKKALTLGMDKNKVFFCKTGDEVYKILRPYLNKNTIVLLKVTHRVMVQSSFVRLKKKLLSDSS